MHVPDKLKDVFKELPPLFKNTKFERHHLSAELQQLAKTFSLVKNGVKCLVASYSAEQFMITTDYIRWCLNHDLTITKCYHFLFYKKPQHVTDLLNFVIETDLMLTNPSV